MWEFRREHEAVIRALHGQRKRAKPWPIAAGHTWALDLTFIRSPHGTTFTVQGILDAGSRKLLCLKLLPRKCAFTVLGHQDTLARLAQAKGVELAALVNDLLRKDIDLIEIGR